MLQHLDPLMGGRQRGQPPGDPAPGGRSAGMHDPPLRVPALEAERQAAAAIAVEAHAEALELTHPAGRVLAEHPHRARPGGPAARDERVLSVALG